MGNDDAVISGAGGGLKFWSRSEGGGVKFDRLATSGSSLAVSRRWHSATEDGLWD